MPRTHDANHPAGLSQRHPACHRRRRRRAIAARLYRGGVCRRSGAAGRARILSAGTDRACAAVIPARSKPRTACATAISGRKRPKPTPTGEDYDLIVVGGGISGLAAAHFYRAKHPGARILILDNHDDFGGHAKRNEFSLAGHIELMNGGTLMIDSPRPYSAVADGLLENARHRSRRTFREVHAFRILSVARPAPRHFPRQGNVRRRQTDRRRRRCIVAAIAGAIATVAASAKRHREN